MAREQKVLYKIEGGTAEEQKRVQAAMDWLLSPKSWGIGKNLLNKAYKLHKKPVVINITKNSMIGYNDSVGENTVYINFDQLDNVTYFDYKGQPYNGSLESTLAHELVHAGQKGLVKAGVEKSRLERKIMQELFGEDRTKEFKKQMSEVASAHTYESAMEKLENVVDKFLSDRNLVKIVSNHESVRAITDEFEPPAVNAERLVSSAQKLGVRKDYDSHSLPPEIERKMVINQFVSMFGINDKPRSKETQPWVNVVGGGKDVLPSAESHVRVAQQESVGKQL